MELTLSTVSSRPLNRYKGMNRARRLAINGNSEYIIYYSYLKAYLILTWICLGCNPGIPLRIMSSGVPKMNQAVKYLQQFKYLNI
jgi:hypothetical protein